MRVYYDEAFDGLVIEGTKGVYPAKSLTYTRVGDDFNITLSGASRLVAGPVAFGDLRDINNGGFASASSVEAYLEDEFSKGKARSVAELNALIGGSTGGGGGYTNQGAFRIYLYPDERWVTDSDDNYGIAYYQAAESGGTGANPILEWEHQGVIVRAGTVVTGLTQFARVLDAVNNTDFEYAAYFVAPNPITRYQTGIDADGEMAATEIVRDFWRAHSTQLPFVALNDRLRRYEALDFTCPTDGELRMYWRPVKALTADTGTDYVQMTRAWHLVDP